MSFPRIILTACLFFLVTSCKVKKSLSSNTETFQSTESNENTSSSRTQISDDWYSTASSLESRDGNLAIDFDGPAVITIRPDQTIEASGHNATIRGTTSSTRADTSSQRATFSQLTAQDTASRSESGMEALSQVEDINISRTPSLTPWIGAGAAVAITVLAVLWFLFRKPKI